MILKGSKLIVKFFVSVATSVLIEVPPKIDNVSVVEDATADPSSDATVSKRFCVAPTWPEKSIVNTSSSTVVVMFVPPLIVRASSILSAAVLPVSPAKDTYTSLPTKFSLIFQAKPSHCQVVSPWVKVSFIVGSFGKFIAILYPRCIYSVLELGKFLIFCKFKGCFPYLLNNILLGDPKRLSSNCS